MSADNWNPNTATPDCDWCGECEWCDNLHSDPTPRVQAIEAAEDRAEQAAFDSWRERKSW
jgi:hypothetical protein